MGSFLVFGFHPVGMSTVVAAAKTRTGIEQGGGAQHRNQSPSGALVSPRVPIFRNVYRGDYCPLFSQRIFYLVGCPVGSKYTIKVNLPGKVAALPGRFLFY